MKRTSLVILLVSCVIATGYAARDDFRPLDGPSTDAITGKCYTTSPAATCPDVNESCGATVCNNGTWFSSDYCPGTVERHSNPLQLIATCRDAGPNGKTGCASGNLQSCGHTKPCGTACFDASNGNSYCQGPANVETLAFWYNGNHATGPDCLPPSPTASTSGSDRGGLGLDSINLVAHYNGAGFSPF